MKKLKIFVKQISVRLSMTEKIDVIGTNAHPFYKWAKIIMAWGHT